ncbi:MAG: hypothetical protein ACLSW7_08200 [Acutalibacteraceae bacterium]
MIFLIYARNFRRLPAKPRLFPAPPPHSGAPRRLELTKGAFCGKILVSIKLKTLQTERMQATP